MWSPIDTRAAFVFWTVKREKKQILIESMMGRDMEIIAHIRTDLPEKFGIPRQSGLVKELQGTIVFEPKYRNALAVQGLEQFSYIWVLWQFEGVEREKWVPTVRPPRLGGNTEMGVFATRSPFRPNAIGLSSLRLLKVEIDPKQGPLLHVAGVDMRDRTPIFDIKPYLKYADCHEDANDGFAGKRRSEGLQVEFPELFLRKIPEDKREGLRGILSQDPRPAYHDDPSREYGVAFCGFNVKFRVENGILSVTGVECI